MARHRESTVRQLDFDSDHQITHVNPNDKRQCRPAQLAPMCVVCERHSRRLMFVRHQGYVPAKLCLHCYHVVMRHTKLLRADLSSAKWSRSTPIGEADSAARQISGDFSLIVSPGSRLSAESRDARLNHRRRRAQVAARRAVLNCND